MVYRDSRCFALVEFLTRCITQLHCERGFIDMVKVCAVGQYERDERPWFLPFNPGWCFHREVVGQLELVCKPCVAAICYQLVRTSFKGEEHVVGVGEQIVLAKLVDVVFLAEFYGMDGKFA